VFALLIAPLITGAAGSPHHADGGDAVSFLTAPLAAVLGVTGLLAGALVAGIALLRGPAAPTRRVAVAAEAGAGYAVAVLALGWLGGGVGALTAVPSTAAVVAVAVLLTRSPRGVAVGSGIGLAALLAVETGLALGVLPAAAVPAAVLGLGVLASVAGAADRAAELRRRTPLALLALAGTAGTALAGAALAGLRFDGATAGSPYGLVLALGLVLLVVAVAGWALARSSAGRWVVPGAVGAGTCAVLALTALVAFPAPIALPGTGAPLLRTVALGGRPVPVAVVPQRPGPNLVYVGAGQAVVDGVATQARDGAPGSWAVVDLAPGAQELVVTAGAERAVLRLRPGADPAPSALVAGLTGPDGPECLSAVVGALAGGGAIPGTCPGAALTASDASTLRATVRFLAERSAPVLHVIGDGSPRSAAATEVVTAAAAEHGLPLAGELDTAGAVLVVAGWETGGRRLVDEARGVGGLGLSTVHGTYTAPWLATGPVLGRQTGAVTALTVDPRAEPAQRYVAALRASGVTALASPAGLTAWGGVPDGGPRIFTAVQVSVMPGDHAHATDTWLPGGTFTAVTPPLPV
jgi:hypothetical protein